MLAMTACTSGSLRTDGDGSRQAAAKSAPGSGASRSPVAGVPLTDDAIAAIIAAPGRSEADRRNDVRRKPAQTLAFMELRSGMTALDLISGGGYTTELLARAIGPSGHVYAHGLPPAPNVNLQNRLARLETDRAAMAPIDLVVQSPEAPIPPSLAAGSLDLVTFMYNYHDLGSRDVDRAAMNRAIHDALRPDGHYIVADHSGRPGTGITEAGTLHRVEESLVRREIEAAGFTLESEGQFLRNPADPRDRKDPEDDQPKDEFLLKFVRR